MDKIELRNAAIEATRLGRPLIGYSAKQINEAYAGVSQRVAAGIASAPGHIRARILESRLAKLGLKPEPEIAATPTLDSTAEELAVRLSILQSLSL